MPVSLLTRRDLDWAVAVLGERRRTLVPYAPLFWRPSPGAAAVHRRFLERLLTDGARGYRTRDSVLIAVPRDDGWLVDDAYLLGDGPDLWNAFDADAHGAAVRFVCPCVETGRGEFASAAGLSVAESWWLLELPGSRGGEAGTRIPLPGAAAVTVGAPPVYAPPGPILYLPAPTDAEAALPAAAVGARELGCAAVVVNQVAGEDLLTEALATNGFRRHCDYYTGVVGPA